ncbi:hypothetical protein HQ585_02585 [candidate division KSB1 bacterium]|nr:hypothetical protein [candidate division KSB1 bacterium]
MNTFDQLVLLATGLTAIYLIVRLFQDNKRLGSPAVHNTYYLASFIVLLVSGLLLIWKGWDILPNPEVIVVTTLLPLGIATGLVHEFHKDKAKGYLIFAIVGFLAILVTRFAGAPRGLQIFTLAFFHSIAGFTIVLIPYFATKAGKVPGGFIGVSIGGVLIGIGGTSLAFLKSGNPILSAELIMTILAPLLLLMTLAYTFGFVKKIVAAKKG